jgi:hypothetical protein
MENLKIPRYCSSFISFDVTNRKDAKSLCNKIGVEGDEMIETTIQLKQQHNFYFTPNQTPKWLWPFLLSFRVKNKFKKSIL